jgi:hypothetical protein
MISYMPFRGVIAYTLYESQHESNDFFFNLAPGIVPCLNHCIATLSSATSITGVPDSQVY